MLDAGLTCDLCGMAIEDEPIVKEIEGETHYFCCGGCSKAYQNAHEADLLGEVHPHHANNSCQLTSEKKTRGKKDMAYFSMEGMWCAGCAIAAENVLKNQAGVNGVDISFAAERGRINFDPETFDVNAGLEKLDKLGYRARVLSDEAQRKREKKQEKTLLQLITAMAFGMQVMVLYLTRLYPLYNMGQFTSLEVRNLQYMVWALSTPVLFIGGISFIKGAWRALLGRTATMDTLVAMGTLSAYSYSVYITLTVSGETYFDSVAMITAFIMIGRYLEAVGGSQARKDIRNLLDLQPDKAWRKVDGDWKEVKVVDISIDDLLLVKPGERVPVDGEIVSGQASFNEAVLTGESLPIDKKPGDEIYAGTMVTDNAVQFRVTDLAERTRLAAITRIVDQTLAHKPPIQRLADKASTYFAFGILVAAVLTLAGWLISGASISQALLNAVAVLVVACPCALGLATPLAITVALGNITQEGILVRNPTTLESTSKVQRMVLDKTGTLTRGVLQVQVVEVAPDVDISAEDLLAAAASVDQFSQHPIARAITLEFEGKLLAAEDFRSEHGVGVQAMLAGEIQQVVKVGSAYYLQLPEGSELLEKARSRGQDGESVVWVGWGEKVRGFISLRDQPSESAAAAIEGLKDLGIKVTLLSGDSPETTRAIAEEVGLASYQGGLLPTEKAGRIKDWQESGELVAMVGDGVNDAPALAQSDLSITVAGGTAVAGETSDIVLMRSDLELIPWFVRKSKRVRRIIYENLGWAFAYNLVALPLAALGIITPVIAAITMASSSLLVVGNSLRLRRK